jgi:hypothetical protein
VPKATIVTTGGTGRYTITWLEAGPTIVNLGDVQVTGYGSNAQCKALKVRESSVDVQCYGADGAGKDSRFMVMLHS